MSKPDFYLNCDSRARRHTLYLSAAAGASFGGVAEAVGATFNSAVIACVVAATAVEVIRIIYYSMPDKKERRSVSGVPNGKYLIWAGMTVLVLLVSFVARVPHRVMAGFEQQLNQAASDPTTPRNIEKAKKTLEAAHAAGIQLSPHVVQNTGKKFFRAAHTDTESWGTAQQYLDYRSFLNKDFAPNVGQLTPWGNHPDYQSQLKVRPNPHLGETPIRSLSVSFAGGHVPSDKGARMESIDSHLPKSSGIAFFVIDGGYDALVLDDMYMKNVIVRNSEVAYSGAAIRLENVFFVNCKFQFERTPNAIALGNLMLDSAPVNFDAP